MGGFAKSATYIDAELAARSKIKRDIEKQEKTLDKVRELSKKEENLKKLLKEGEEENLKVIENMVKDLEDSKAGKTPEEIEKIDTEITEAKGRTLMII